MKDDNFENKTTVALKSNFALIKMITIALLFLIVFLLIGSVYGMATKEDNGTYVALFVVGISCSATLPLQFMNMKKIKTELKSREN
jgi:hypothetical protein